MILQTLELIAENKQMEPDYLLHWLKKTKTHCVICWLAACLRSADAGILGLLYCFLSYYEKGENFGYLSTCASNQNRELQRLKYLDGTETHQKSFFCFHPSTHTHTKPTPRLPPTPQDSKQFWIHSSPLAGEWGCLNHLQRCLILCHSTGAPKGWPENWREKWSLLQSSHFIWNWSWLWRELCHQHNTPSCCSCHAPRSSQTNQASGMFILHCWPAFEIPTCLLLGLPDTQLLKQKKKGSNIHDS